MSHYKKSCGKPHLSPGKQDFVALTDRVHPSFASLPTLREEHSSTSPQPLLLRTVSDLRASYVLRTASNGLLPKWGEGEPESKSLSRSGRGI